MIAIVKYNAGNIFSVYCALKRLGYDAVITDNPDELRAAEKVIFPGVGDARAAMEHLNKTRLADVIKDLRQPVLGICIGMQLLCR
ncbi:MAG: imidazole glycerol phosphate synthase subunit HisH, partial [Bacteroidales bacterium]|nr:imidazole glycerol phosphate synthase subunit HisH [Bacteroidales bacterium]